MTTYGPWERTPIWRQLFGAREYRRRRFASPMIGGGFDGWEYSTPSDSSPLAARTPEQSS